jgi:hypothetical protein
MQFLNDRGIGLSQGGTAEVGHACSKRVSSAFFECAKAREPASRSDLSYNGNVDPPVEIQISNLQYRQTFDEPLRRYGQLVGDAKITDVIECLASARDLHRRTA